MIDESGRVVFDWNDPPKTTYCALSAEYEQFAASVIERAAQDPTPAKLERARLIASDKYWEARAEAVMPHRNSIEGDHRCIYDVYAWARGRLRELSFLPLPSVEREIGPPAALPPRPNPGYRGLGIIDADSVLTGDPEATNQPSGLPDE